VARGRERLLELHERYRRAGTLEAVGREMGVTRERVRQLLRKGAWMGLYPYPAARRRRGVGPPSRGC
jgi:ribosomal protein S14